MGVGTDDLRVDECRTLPCANVFGCLAHRAQAREEISAVDRIDMQPGKRSYQARYVAAWRLHLDRHRDRVAVVLDQEKDRQALGACGAQRLPEFAFAGCPV